MKHIHFVITAKEFIQKEKRKTECQSIALIPRDSEGKTKGELSILME